MNNYRRNNTIFSRAMTIAITLVALCSSCTNLDESTESGKTDIPAQKLFQIAAFPTYSDSLSTRLVIGSEDAGKTKWENGDTIYLKMDLYDGYNTDKNVCTGDITKSYIFCLSFTGFTWTIHVWDGNNYVEASTLHVDSNQGVKFTAYYAPNYTMETATGKLLLKEGKYPASAEYLVSTKEVSVSDLQILNLISFTRNYSRLRIHTPKGFTVKMNISSGTFTSAEGKTGVNEYYTTSDDNENAFIYGYWNNMSVEIVTKVNGNDYYLPEWIKGSSYKAIYAKTSISGNSYAINAMPSHYNSMGDGTSSSPYLLCTNEQIQDMCCNLSETSHDYFQMIRDIDMSYTQVTHSDNNFEGIFDGNFHTISNYNTGFYKAEHMGLFTTVMGDFNASGAYSHDVYGIGTYGIVKNLTLDHGLVFIDNRNGGKLADAISNAAIINCRVINSDLSILSDNYFINEHCGALIGKSFNSFVYACCASNNTISSLSHHHTLYSAGLIGSAEGSAIIGCYANVGLSFIDLWGGYATQSYAGLVGVSEDCYYLSCYANPSDDGSKGMASLVYDSDDDYYLYCATNLDDGANMKFIGTGSFYDDKSFYRNNISIDSIASFITSKEAESAFLNNYYATHFRWQFARDIASDGVQWLWRKDVDGKLRLWWEIDKFRKQ